MACFKSHVLSQISREVEILNKKAMWDKGYGMEQEVTNLGAVREHYD